MTSNNLEAIAWIKCAISELNDTLLLLQADEVEDWDKVEAVKTYKDDPAFPKSEVQEDCIGKNCMMWGLGKHPMCHIAPPKPTKETKLVINNVRYELVSLGSVDVGKKHYPEVFALKKEEY